MRYRFTRNKYSIVLAAIVVTTIAFWFVSSSFQPASARLADGSVRFVSNSVFGMIPGETVRVCFGTTNPRGPELDWLVRFVDEQGTLLFQLADQRSPAGQWRCANIDRNMFGVAGDAGTGRAQVAMEVVVNAPPGTKSSEIIGTAEIVAATGATQAYWTIELENTLISPVQL